jgi:hypothetical protein
MPPARPCPVKDCGYMTRGLVCQRHRDEGLADTIDQLVVTDARLAWLAGKDPAAYPGIAGL